MSEESLRELLAQVHERLRQAGSVDQDSRAMLATVMRDIERALNRGTPATAAKTGAVPRVEALAVQLEADHPALGQALRQLIDLLVKAGM
jgi:hypothetical protein